MSDFDPWAVPPRIDYARKERIIDEHFAKHQNDDPSTFTLTAQEYRQKVIRDHNLPPDPFYRDPLPPDQINI